MTVSDSLPSHAALCLLSSPVKQLNGSPVSQQLQMRKGDIDQMLNALTQARLVHTYTHTRTRTRTHTHTRFTVLLYVCLLN